LSALTTSEAEALIREKEGNLCARLYLRDDDTVITADCPVGVRRKWISRAAGTVVAFVGAAAAVVGYRLQPAPIPLAAAEPAPNPPPAQPIANPGMLGAPDPVVIQPTYQAKPVPEKLYKPQPRHAMGAMIPPRSRERI
jgi:hypothetical protein